MSVKSKRKERRRKLKAETETKNKAGQAAEEEPYTLNAILAEFRANKELEQAAEGIKPVKDADFEKMFDDIPAPERVADDATEISADAAPEDSAETTFDLSGAFDVADGADRAPFAAETSADLSAPEESAETTFDLSGALDVADGADRAPFMTEASADLSATEESAETTFDLSKAFDVADSADRAPLEAETSADLSATEESAETTFHLSEAVNALDSAFDSVSAAEEADGAPKAEAAEASAEEVSAEKPLETDAVSDADAPDAESLSDTQRFSRAVSAAPESKSAAPTFWRRLFGNPDKRKEPPETKEDGEPRSISLEEVVGNTVDAVRTDKFLEGQSGRRSLFSRRRMEDAEDELPGARPEIIGPEPNLKTAAEQARREYVRRIEGILPAVVPAVLPLLVLILEALGVRFPLLTGSVILRPLLLLACLGATLWLCRSVFTDNVCTSTFLCGISAIAAALDCLTMPFMPGRSMAEPYGAVACLALLSAKLGSSLESHGVYDAFHAAGLDRNPPYLVTDTVHGARKRRGVVTGFYTATLSQNFSNRWQTIFLPVTLAASLAFAALSSVGQERGGDFFLNWSAILSAGATLVLPLCWGLPWARLASRLKNAGCAIAGWRGAEQIARKKKMILTDSDLFPPGSVRLEDMRVYDEETPTVISITASMIRESGCGLERIFDDLLKSESAEYLPVRDFHFYEDGGFSGTIQEEKVLLGTSSFLRKMSVRFPGDFYFPTGIYLAINGELAATFALKYEAAENVDYALRMMRRNHVTAILAARDPNVNPKLLQRVFRRKIDVEYPGFNNRVALSDMRKSRDLPRGLLFREGLPPYAETVVGSLRLCAGVRRSTRLALFGSAVGTLLSFYLVYQGKYYLFSPLNLLIFLLLWTAPAILLMDLS